MEALGDIRWGDTLFSLGAFIILFLVLRRYAFGPLMGIMEERAKNIEADLEQAKENRQEAEQLLATQRQELDIARKDADKIIDNARATSEKQAASIMQTARQEVEQIKTVARKELEREKEQAIEALRAEFGQISVLLAEKVMKKEIDDKQQEKLVNDYLKEVGNKKWVQ